MQLLMIVDQSYGTNTYVYFDENSREGVVIDPGDCLEELREVISQHEIKVTAILLTHGHFDHTFRVNELRELTGAPVYAHEGETELLKNSEYNRSGNRGLEISVVADKLFKDGDVFDFTNGTELRVIHTPGHTAGGCCYYNEAAGIIFTGDTLFRETIGRTDMPTGNHAALVASVRERLFTLPENTTVFPGHEESSDISHEKKYNVRANL